MSLRANPRRSAGFTLVELMIVIGILGILAGMWVQNAMSASEEARATTCEKNRVLYEDSEQLFFHREGRPSDSLTELVDEKYLNKATCPRGGVLVWEVTDPELNYDHQSLVCSIHGPKQRIRSWKNDTGEEEETGPSPLGAGFEDGTWGSWLTTGLTKIVDSSFGSSYAGDKLAYVDTNTNYWSVVSKSKIASFLGVKASELQAMGKRKYTGGSAMKIEAGDSTLENLRFNFLTQEATPTYWYNDTAFMTISNKSTGKSEVYKLVDTYSKFTKSKTKFKEETGWLSLADLGIEAEIEKGDTIGFGVMNAGDKIVSSAILIDEGEKE